MTSAPTRVFAARLAGLNVTDPNGDQIGKVRDLVVVLQSRRVVGLVVEVGRRQIFAPMTRVTGIYPDRVTVSGALNVRRFEKRRTETLVIGELFDRRVRAGDAEGLVYDIAMDQSRTRDWLLSRVALREPGRRFGRRGQTRVVAWEEVVGLEQVAPDQGASALIESIAGMKPADAATVLLDLPPERRDVVVADLAEESLADLIEELPDEEQRNVVASMVPERAAEVLGEMSPDDAADLLAMLPGQTAATLLALMEPDDATGVRRLLEYGEETAGGMMTPEPVVLAPDATVAEALARVRNPDLTPSLAALVYVCRPPLSTPTGTLLGVAHIQRLLREQPSDLVAGMVDQDMSWLSPDATLEEVATHLAIYNLVAAPVTDEEGRLLGAVTVDDLLDHLLPEGWRDRALHSRESI